MDSLDSLQTLSFLPIEDKEANLGRSNSFSLLDVMINEKKNELESYTMKNLITEESQTLIV